MPSVRRVGSLRLQHTRRWTILHTDISVLLPLGLIRPVYARLEGTRRPPHWVRAGDLHHGPAGFVLRPPWDGAAFEVIWKAAVVQTGLPSTGRESGPEVVFAVHSGTRLVPVARAELNRTVMRHVRWSR
ncbi:MAG: hypothetical protein CMJ34_13425 [Phycisphaerae bacterium]|nr:hypothetical protein [Phycisphaerae bacterium]